MTRCYEYYCMDKKCREAEMSRTMRWRIDKYMKMMEDNGVLFNKTVEDESLFHRLAKKHGSERSYCDCVSLREQRLPRPVPDGKYAVIVVDPPWPSDSDVVLGVVHQYRTMEVEEIEALAVPAADDCILWLWAINNMIHEAYHVLDTWGFEPQSVLTWVKNQFGTGYWLRGQTEHCILATRGHPPWTNTSQTTVLYADIREHSRKPDEFYAMVDRLCTGPKLDMFSREKREGWDQWGDETDKF